MLMAALRLNIPTVFVSGGPMEAGKTTAIDGVVHAKLDLIDAMTASAKPTWRYSSRVRACTASAREVVPGSAVWSIIRTRTPSRVIHSAKTRPVGPAPMI